MKGWNELLVDAIAIAAKAHGHTSSKDGWPYILHPLRLMMKADPIDEKVIAVLHDVVEDTSVTLEDLRDAGFWAVLDDIDRLTKREGEDYEQFIRRIGISSRAARVKTLDLEDNINLLRLPKLTSYDLQRAAKYHEAIRELYTKT